MTQIKSKNRIEMVYASKYLSIDKAVMSTYCRARLNFHNDKRDGMSVSLFDYVVKEFAQYNLSHKDILGISNECSKLFLKLMEQRSIYEILDDGDHVCYMTSEAGSSYPILY